MLCCAVVLGLRPDRWNSASAPKTINRVPAPSRGRCSPVFGNKTKSEACTLQPSAGSPRSAVLQPPRHNIITPSPMTKDLLSLQNPNHKPSMRSVQEGAKEKDVGWAGEIASYPPPSTPHSYRDQGREQKQNADLITSTTHEGSQLVPPPATTQ